MVILNKYWNLSLFISLFGSAIGRNIIELSDSCTLTITKSEDIIITEDSKCTVGIFLPEEIKPYYIECNREDNGNISCSKKDLPKKNKENKCNNESTGKLINIGHEDDEYVFCLGKFGFDYPYNYPYIKLRGSNKYGNYFVKHTFPSTKNVFTFESEALYYIVKYDEYGIAFDENLNFTDHCANTSGRAITRKEDFCSSNSSGLYYTCKNGICKDIHTIENYEPVEQEELKYCIVKTGENCSVDTYYLIDETTMRKQNQGDGSLYYCENKNESCKKINMPGYYIVDKNNYYICRKDTNRKYTKCEKITLNENNDTCEVGKMILINKKLYLCIATSSKIPINENNNEVYIMEMSPNENENIFDLNEEQKAIIKINGSEIKLFKNYNNNLRYTYAIKSTHKIFNKDKDQLPTDENGKFNKNEIYELICNKGICKEVNQEYN